MVIQSHRQQIVLQLTFSLPRSCLLACFWKACTHNALFFISFAIQHLHVWNLHNSTTSACLTQMASRNQTNPAKTHILSNFHDIISYRNMWNHSSNSCASVLVFIDLASGFTKIWQKYGRRIYKSHITNVWSNLNANPPPQRNQVYQGTILSVWWRGKFGKFNAIAFADRI